MDYINPGCSITEVRSLREAEAWVQFPAPRMERKLIIFDLWGTLAFQNPKLKTEEFFNFYSSLGIDLKTKEDFQNFSKIFAKIMKESENWEELGVKLIRETLGEDFQKGKKLANFLRENLSCQLFDDAKEILNLPLPKAILTDSPKFLFSNLGLEKYFQIFTPKETNFLKPDQRAFLVVLDFFKVKPKEALMVGDEIERDLIPAKNLGMDTILVERKNKIENSIFKKISSLKELKNFLVGP